ncbi:MAG: hypothetical protein RRY18_05030, partial [Clostridia bacterium]
MKKFFLIMWRNLPLALVVVFCVCVISFMLPYLPSEVTSDNAQTKYNGIIELWHIDCFETGAGAKSQFLSQEARVFEKANKGTLAHITILTYEQMLYKLKEGQTFDIISFPLGVGVDIVNYLAEYSGKINLADNFYECGQMGERTYATPYMSGGYCLIAEKGNLDKFSNFSSLSADLYNLGFDKKVGKNTVSINSLICGYAQFSSPLTAVALLSNKANQDARIDIAPTNTQYTAYQKFVSNSATALLGTQRDIFRLSNRVSSGKIGELVFSPLNTYTDLIQLMGVSREVSTAKRMLCQNFIEQVSTERAQRALVDIGMFSVCGQRIYTEGIYLDMQNALTQVKVPNAFITKESLYSLKECSREGLYKN